jgi:hypothetical protein
MEKEKSVARIVEPQQPEKLKTMNNIIGTESQCSQCGADLNQRPMHHVCYHQGEQPCKYGHQKSVVAIANSSFEKLSLYKDTPPSVATDHTTMIQQPEQPVESQEDITANQIEMIELKAQIKILLMLESACGRMKILHKNEWIEVDDMRVVLRERLSEVDKLITRKPT